MIISRSLSVNISLNTRKSFQPPVALNPSLAASSHSSVRRVLTPRYS